MSTSNTGTHQPATREPYTSISEASVALEDLVPEISLASARRDYPMRVEPLLAKLLYFFIQAPAPDAPAGTIVRIVPTLQESQARVREVTYDRGTVIDELAREASRMSAASERLHSFEDSYSSKRFVFALCFCFSRFHTIKY